MRVGVEIGGTFTDLVAVTPDGIRTVKVNSTPSAPEQGVFSAFQALGIPLKEASAIIHGSTVATNALLERKGADLVFIVTEGFRDLLELQREVKSRNYDLRYKRTLPLVARDRVIEVCERMGADGEVIEAVDVEDLKVKLNGIRREGVQSVAVCLLHSYRNPVHEHQVRKTIGEIFPDLMVSLSSEVMPEFREYERASTTVMNAYLSPVILRYLDRLKAYLDSSAFAGRFYVMQSSGGMLPADNSQDHAVRMVLSGPAGGIIGAIHTAAKAGYRDLITLDMGGTSTDISLVESSQPLVTTNKNIDRLPIMAPMLDIATIGAGGGSIAWIDESGLLNVGPRSAGAQPGPACYGRGGKEPTLTDALVVMGILRPKQFLGGRMVLDAGAAEAAVGGIARHLGLSLHEAAEGIFRIATANMIQATRQMSIERGHDPRDYVLVPYGGAGPLHAVTLAEELKTRGIYVPPNPGVMSALGLVLADFRRDYVVTIMSELEQLDPKAFAAAVKHLAEEAQHDVETMRPEGTLDFAYAADLRYSGQGYELGVALVEPAVLDVAKLTEDFHAQHKKSFGHNYPNDKVSIVNIRLRLTASQKTKSRDEISLATSRPAGDEGRIWLNSTQSACRFFDRRSLSTGVKIKGPAVIEEESASTLLPAGWLMTVDQTGGMFIQKKEQ